MILFEYEGKKLLKDAGIAVPNSILIDSSDPEMDSRIAELPGMTVGLVLKAQVLSGKRADAGGIIMVDEISNLKTQISNLLGKIINQEKVEKILIEPKIDFDKEFYVSISYDSDYRSPILSISEVGGTGIEERGVTTYPINPLNPTQILKQVQDDSGIDKNLLEKLINLFFDADCLLLEINPLVKTKKGEYLALDAKIKLDDFAKSRHKDWDFAPRSAPGHNPTKGEIEAKKIDEGDYRGTAGSSYFDLKGDIAVLSSGGGVSLTALDALINNGGEPANFTEYSGNPPKEKVAKLTKIVLDKPNIHGLWVIGTVVANFTDIYETLSGFIEGLRQAQDELGTKFDFPIVIRRGGPRVEEAYEMLSKIKDFDLHLQGEETSIAQSAKIMAQLAKKYATTT